MGRLVLYAMIYCVINITVIAGMILDASSADGTGSRGTRGSGGRGGPPPEAIAACRNMSEGTAVTFKSPRGDTISAICKQMGGQLAAVPLDAPPAPPGGAPAGAER